MQSLGQIPALEQREQFSRASDYRARADQHRPSDPVDIAREMRRLATDGWTPHGIGLALRIDPVAVRHALADAQREFSSPENGRPPAAPGGEFGARGVLGPPV